MTTRSSISVKPFLLRIAVSFPRDFLIYLKISHPLRPVFGMYTTSFGPGTSRVELAMPLKRPQLLESNLSDRPVHKQHIILTSHMPINTEDTHICTKVNIMVFQSWRFISRIRPSTKPATIQIKIFVVIFIFLRKL